jgi:hypothetical protein
MYLLLLIATQAIADRAASFELMGDQCGRGMKEFSPPELRSGRSSIEED